MWQPTLLWATRLVTVLGIVALPALARATSTDITASADTYIDSYYPTTNYGTGTLLYEGSASTSIPFSQPIMTFNLSGIPAGATIDSATWSGYITISYGSSTGYFRRVLRNDWTETGATWNVYKAGSSWTSAGCNSSGNDYTTTNEVAYSFPNSTGTQTLAGFGGMVADAIAAGQNLHIIMRETNAPFVYVHYWASREDSTPSRRPMLTVVYTAATTTTTTLVGGMTRRIFVMD